MSTEVCRVPLGRAGLPLRPWTFQGILLHLGAEPVSGKSSALFGLLCPMQ